MQLWFDDKTDALLKITHISGLFFSFLRKKDWT